MMNEQNVCMCMCVRACMHLSVCMPIVYANRDVSGPSVVASFHGNTSLRAKDVGERGKGVETIIMVEGAEKGRARETV